MVYDCFVSMLSRSVSLLNIWKQDQYLIQASKLSE